MKVHHLTLLLLTLVCSVATVAAQETPDAPMLQYQVEHKHGLGSGKGELRLTDDGIEYRGVSKNEGEHSRTWRDEDIKRLEIARKKLRVTVYEAGSVSLLPRRFPGVKKKSVPVGNERTYEFRLCEGEIAPETVSRLLARFHRPLSTSVLPDGAASGKLLFEIPVFHRHRAGGATGVLSVFEQSVVFKAENDDQSRFWRYSDLRDVSRLGRYGFELATYEGETGTDGRNFVFDLKRPMTEAEYEILWKKIYQP